MRIFLNLLIYTLCTQSYQGVCYMNLTITPNFNVKNNQQNQINPLNILKFAQKNNEVNGSNLAPLSRDTISFSGKEKIVGDAVKVVEKGLRSDKVGGDYANGIQRQIAQQLFDMTEVPMGYYENLLHRYFDKLVANENNPNRVVRRILTNHKPVSSIEEKLNALAAKEKERIEEAGGFYTFSGMHEAKGLVNDIVRATIVMRDSSKKSVRVALQQFIKMFKETPGLKLKEIENYYPEINDVPDWVRRGYQKDLGIKLDDKKIKEMKAPAFFSYADVRDLKELETLGRVRNPEMSVKYGVDRANGYQGLHINGELPDGTPFELQFSGEHVVSFKHNIEDKKYKASCNKGVDNPVLAERLAPFADENEKELKAEHTIYTRWVYIGERLKSPEMFSKKEPRARYLTAPKSILDRGLGYNQLIVAKRQGEVQMMQAEEKAAKTKAKKK